MALTSAFNRGFRSGERPGALSQVQIASSAQVWYDASTNGYFQPTNPSSGTGITQWNDRSNAAHNASPVGAGQTPRPTWQSSVLNSLGIVRFDGSAKNLQVSNTTWLQSLSGFTLVILAKASALSGTRFLTNTDQSGASIYFNGTNFVTRTASGVGTTSLTGDTSSFNIYTQVFDGTQADNATRLRFFYDGIQQTLNFNGTTVGTQTNASTNKLNFAWDGTGNYWNGDIAEIMMWGKKLSTTERVGVEKYLEDKWAL